MIEQVVIPSFGNLNLVGCVTCQFMSTFFDVGFLPVNSWFHRPSLRFPISFRAQVTCTYTTWLPQLSEIRHATTRPNSHVLEASIKLPKELLFFKYTGLNILHTMWGLVVRGHLAPLCMLFLPRKPILYISNSTRGCLQAGVSIEYVTAPLSLTGSVHIEEWLKISPKTSLAICHRAIKSI